MKSKVLLIALILSPLIFIEPANAQFMKKVKQKVNEEKNKLLNDALGVEETKENTGYETNSSDKPTSGRPASENRGKKMTPPDVNENIDLAISAYNSGDFTESRYSVQQALQGLELEIGYAILDNLPSAISAMPSHAENDEVASSGYGWVGLIIHREYWNDDKAIDVTVASNSILAGTYGAMFSSGMYASEQYKSVRISGNRASLHYDENSGQYQLGIPLGQSTALGFDFTNFESEDEVIAAAEQVDINSIKALLGEK